jgi:acyl-CoA synthetase (AMP-forming)/AMP-acid ligase II
MTALSEALAYNARTRGSDIAIDCGSGGTLAWTDFQRRVSQNAEYFAAQFGANGRAVATAFGTGATSVISDLALLEAGIAAIPLPGFFTSKQRSHALATSGAQAVISGRGELEVERLELKAVTLPTETAKISFTSGSTGTPKGIYLSADHMLAVAVAVVNAVGTQHAGRHLALLPPAILLENIAGLYATILAGGTYVALPSDDVGLANPFRPDFVSMARAIDVHRITSLILVPEYLAGLVAVMEAGAMRFPALTLVAVGGARVSPALLERASALGLPVRQGYGLTECGSVVALESGDETERGSVGKSLGLNKISIAPDGEILIGWPLCLGAESPLHTGDLGRLDETGNLWIEGRKSNLIITAHGRNISPEWVESALLAQDGIAQAMVYGEAASALSALIAPSSLDADLGAAVAAANATLPEYAHVAEWRGVLPFTPANGQLTGNGRPKRDAISAAYLNATAPFFDRLVADTASGQLLIAANPPTVSIWLGTRTTAATHYDYSNNIACCLVGRRRFTLFPPDQIANLYPGPLEPTPGGQVVSLVDLNDPDLARYPRFRNAADAGQVAELNPGDVLFYPALWWHQVEALAPFNAMMNYWWNTSPQFIDSPMTTVLHGLLSLRDRPQAEKSAWRQIFDYYVFGDADQPRAHIPEHARGALAPLDDRGARRLRAMLLDRLNR